MKEWTVIRYKGFVKCVHSSEFCSVLWIEDGLCIFYADEGRPFHHSCDCLKAETLDDWKRLKEIFHSFD